MLLCTSKKKFVVDKYMLKLTCKGNEDLVHFCSLHRTKQNYFDLQMTRNSRSIYGGIYVRYLLEHCRRDIWQLYLAKGILVIVQKDIMGACGASPTLETHSYETFLSAHFEKCHIVRGFSNLRDYGYWLQNVRLFLLWLVY